VHLFSTHQKASPMPSAVKRLYNRLSRAKGSEDISPNGQRKRALTIPLPEGAREQKTEDHCQSAFFAKLPLEIRQLIYMELLRGEVDVVHVTKQPRKPLEFTRCASKCSMTYNYKCWAGEVPDGRQTTMKASSTLERGLFPLLQTCRRA